MRFLWEEMKFYLDASFIVTFRFFFLLNIDYISETVSGKSIYRVPKTGPKQTPPLCKKHQHHPGCFGFPNAGDRQTVF